jgi:Rieske Fe-S protein
MRETNPWPGSPHAVAKPEPSTLSERRSFLKWAINGLGALFAAVLGVPAVLYLIDPRNRPAPPKGYRVVGNLKDLDVNEPVQAVIRDIRHDAWTLHPNDVVGRVLLVKRDAKKVDVYTTVCPHLGCSVNYVSSAKRFICPCHNGTFDIDGRRVEFTEGINPAPRDLDRLDDVMIDADGTIRVKYETFKQGEAEKERKG